MIGVDEFRAQARVWLSEHMARLHEPARRPARGRVHYSTESIAPHRALQRKLFDAGYAGITWPKEYGGAGLTGAHEQAFLEEAAAYDMPDLGVAGYTTFTIVGPTMLRAAAPQFLQRHIPRMLAGEELVCQFFSEPGAGSDLAGVTTRATRDGDRWILSGSKVWTSGAAYADFGMCLARTNWDVPKHQGLTWFLVPTDAPGVTVLPIRELNGDAEFCEEFLDDVEVGDEDRIGDIDNGWSVAQQMLVFERSGGRSDVNVELCGPGPLAPDLVDLARRVGRDQDPLARQLIARAHIDEYLHLHVLGWRIAQLLESGAGGGVASYLKLSRGITYARRSRIAMEIAGAPALAWEDGDADGMEAALNYLNGRLGGIAGGTNEVQRNGIGERVLGLPREPSFDSVKPFNEVLRNAADFNVKF